MRLLERFDIHFSSHAARGLRESDDVLHPAEAIEGERVALVSGIANPNSFAATAESLGAEVVARLDLADHAGYGPAERDAIDAMMRSSGAEVVLTTEKDAAKLRALGIEVMTLEISLEIEREAELFAGIWDGLRAAQEP